MELRGWDAMAAWRDLRMGEDGDLWHRAIIDPTLLRVVGPVRGRAVLDLGCGNGYLTRRFARRGAVRSVGVDRSAPNLALARRRERAHPTGAVFRRVDATRLIGLEDASFDLVVANMAIQDIRDAATTLREVARVLRPDGRLVLSMSHPCYDLDERSGWVVERVRETDGYWHDLVWRKVRLYRDERAVEVPWDLSGRGTGWTTSYHRTLTTYSRLLRDAGFAISRIEEPSPLPEAVRKSPQGPYMREVPLHLVLEARFLATRGSARRAGGVNRPASRTSAGSSRPGRRRSARGGRRPRSGSPGRGSRRGS